MIHLAACMTPPQPGLNDMYKSGGVNLQKKNTHLAMKLTFQMVYSAKIIYIIKQ